MHTFKDCFCSWDAKTLSVGNERLTRTYVLTAGQLLSSGVQSFGKDVMWLTGEPTVPFVFDFLTEAPVVVEQSENALFRCWTEDNHGCSEPFLRTEVVWRSGVYFIKQHIDTHPELPFITTRLLVQGTPVDARQKTDQADLSTGIEMADEANAADGITDVVDILPISVLHSSIREVQFHDVTDRNDDLVVETCEYLYHRVEKGFIGNVFVVTNSVESHAGNAASCLVAIKEGPTRHGTLNPPDADLRVHPQRHIAMQGSGLNPGLLNDGQWQACYGWTVGVGEEDELRIAYRNLYFLQAGLRKKVPAIVANTWGDRNQDKSLNEAFVDQEIAVGGRIGVDHVQLDDGWQKGITSNSALSAGGVWEGYYASDSESWHVHPTKFPHGLNELCRKAGAGEISISLWFSPDSSGNFANWKKDADTLLYFHRELGVTLYKIDGVKIRNKICEGNYSKFWERLNVGSNCSINLNVDVTAEVRYGYFYEKQIGTIYLENRYTDWGNYYPHRTLRNLWALSRYLPSQRLQIEVLNPRRNVDIYGDDPLAPSNYRIDYLFAIAMVANPLLFMELQFLEEEDVQILSHLVDIYRRFRSDLCACIVEPVGIKPDGFGLSGFLCKNWGDGKPEHLMLFTGIDGDAEFPLSHDMVGVQISRIYRSCPDDMIVIDRERIVVLRARTFVWVAFA